MPPYGLPETLFDVPLNSLKTEGEKGEREGEREKRQLRKGVVRETTFKGGKKFFCFPSVFEGSQTMLTRPSGRGTFER
jgi:hypothetical protein